MDVTSLVTGDGTYSLRISDSVGGADYSSKEGANDPELVLTLGGTPTPTATPGPSLTPTNTSFPTATFTPTPTAILPIFSNAMFTYDGDGKRVKSVITTNIATTTTYFVGAHYEVANGVVTKYYYAGAQRIAIRTNGTLNFLLGDHLGSTSLSTDANGQVVSELRYTAWGETRYASGNPATQYQYTAQYSYVSDFGLHFYNARWYDSSLGRFAQADTIVPSGVQGYDRYAYVNNSPINYTDPSGHRPCEEWEGICFSEDQMTQIWNSQTGGDGGNDDEGGDDNGGEDGGGGSSEDVYSCDDPALGCVTNVGGTWQDPAVYISLAFGGWASGLYSTTFWGAATACISNVVCRWVTGMAGGASSSSYYYRYMVRKELNAIDNTGFLRGGNPGPTYFTTNMYTSASQAQQQLSLTTTPQIGAEFQILNNPQISGPTVVEAIPGLTSGGGTQYWSFDSVQVIINSTWELTP